MKRQVRIALLVGALALNLCLVNSVFGSAVEPGGAHSAAPAAADANSKLSFRLAMLARSATLRAATSEAQARSLSLPPKGAGSLVRDASGKILVNIRVPGLDDARVQDLRNAGAQVTHVSSRYQVVTALVDAASLTNVASVSAVQSIQEQLAPWVAGAQETPGSRAALSATASCPSGAAVSAGDTQLYAAQARAAYGIDGTGVKVGILSDSFDQNTSAVTHASGDIASGDLPGASNPCGYLTPVSVIANNSTSGSTDEGRAMLQIVHDLAPGANLLFASAFNGMYSFADNIRSLRTAGADIIADDVSYYDEPLFQEGPVAAAIGDVVADGAAYFTAAGNDNEVIGGKNVASYEAPSYRPATCPITLPITLPGATCHDFDPTSGVNTGSSITLANYGDVDLILGYNEPWFGVTDNLYLYLLDSSNNIVASSTYDEVNQYQEPFQYLYYQNTSGSSQTYRIVINRADGTGTPRLKYIFFQDTYGLTSVQYNTSSNGDIVGPTLFGHSATEHGSALAAVPYSSTTTPETYSSRGPATHYYGPVVGTTAASPITPVTMTGPDYAATDGGCTTFFYSYSSGCYRFYGTSAAAPHAAAVAALLKELASERGLTFNQTTVKGWLQSTAASMSGGNTNSVGAGLIDALGAAGAIDAAGPRPAPVPVYLPFVQLSP